ncbi:hypothetical protein DFJ77DRAFT_312424 [Powellomyces hirtus]|nr:hypothetical protein DFJ77DRAFT_312424 [Powellomyces hirtus]
MLRQLPSVRAVQFQLQGNENATDKENHMAAGTRTPGNHKLLASKTPMRTGMSVKKANVNVMGTDKENTPLKTAAGPGKMALGVKTPALRAQPTALQGKSVNVKAPKSTVKEPSKPKAFPKTPAPFSAAAPATGGTIKRAVLGQKLNKNTPFMLPMKTPQNKKQQQYDNTPFSQTPLSANVDQTTPAAKIQITDASGQNVLSTRKSSAKKNSARAAGVQQRSVTKVQLEEAKPDIAPAAEEPAVAAVEQEEDFEIEYMPPSTFETKYVPDPDMVVDHSVLLRPRVFHTYVNPEVRARVNNLTDLEFDPKDLVADVMRCPDAVFTADDIPLLTLDDVDPDIFGDINFEFKLRTKA